MNARLKWLIAATLTLLVLGALVAWRLITAGAFVDVESTAQGDCHKIAGISGGEDIQWDPDAQAAYVAAQDRRHLERNGHIYRLAATDGIGQPVDITPELAFPFHPHGLSLYEGPEGRRRLFVVNHRGGMTGPNYVEIFDLDEAGALHHRRSVAGPALISPNDVVGVGPEQFYVSNDHSSPTKIGRALEDLLQLASASVVFYDGSSFRPVYQGAQYANGVNVSADGSEFYLAETTAKRVRIFARDPVTNALRLEQTVEMDAAPDNIAIDGDGVLWIAAHPNLVAFVENAADADARSPSEVVTLARDHAGRWHVEKAYANVGNPISGSSVGAVYQNMLLIGSVFDPFVLECDL